MINKFPGKCNDCGTRVEAGEGEAMRDQALGRWVLRCGDCASGDASRTGVMTTAKTSPATRLDGSYELLSGHAASPYQAAVFDHFKYGTGSVIVKAVAGSGKTTTMKNALRHLPQRASVQMFAFNYDAAKQLKEAVDELRERDGLDYRNVRAGTFHSVGHGALLRHLDLPKEQVKVDTGKCRKILKEMLGETLEGQERYAWYGSFVCELVAKAKGRGIGCLEPDTDERWWSIIEHHGLYLDAAEANEADGIALARKVLARSNEVARTGLIDHDDQLYLVCLWKLRLFRNDVVIVDEAQDTNAVRRAMLHLALRDGGRLYAVGDPKQSIYGFTGATTDAMDRIAKEFNTRELPLTVSYRCARSVVERAQTWVTYIEPSEAAPDGEVLDDLPLCDALTLLTPDDAILCRQTRPLVAVAYALIARGRACRILGKEIGEGLVNLVESQRAKGIDALIEKLEKFRGRETARFIARGEETKAESVADRVGCVETIIESLHANERTVPALVRKIRSMFTDDASGSLLTLATVHKSKGKEWNQVAILRPELMPSAAARQEWQYEQEINCMYVAATRAKTTLIYCRPEDIVVDRPGEAR